jgi:hypothetical protein
VCSNKYEGIFVFHSLSYNLSVTLIIFSIGLKSIFPIIGVPCLSGRPILTSEVLLIIDPQAKDRSSL